LIRDFPFWHEYWNYLTERNQDVIIEERKMSELVLENTNAAAVFEKYGLDYCCHGDIRLVNACKIKFIDQAEIVRELSTVERMGKDTTNPLHHAAECETAALIDYLVTEHHRHFDEVIPTILAHLAECIDSHGSKYPILAKAKAVFTKFTSDLKAHTAKEEKIVFPAIRMMSECLKNHQPMDSMPFGDIADRMRELQFEHDIAGNEMLKIHEIMNDLMPPDDACSQMKLVYKELGDFELEWHLHIFLENFVLFPRAEKLEKEIRMVIPEKNLISYY
jgi:regulator of cell morphogenesis and NO signaling